MRVQLTGASGFIGLNIRQLIKAEFVSSKISLANTFTITEEIFIHLAGIAHNIDGEKRSNDYYYINTDLTKKAFDAFLLSNANKFILLSSVKSIRNESDSIITEDTIEAPSTAYGKSKLEADNYILSQNLPQGKFIYILRPALVTGPGVKGNMLKLFNLSSGIYLLSDNETISTSTIISELSSNKLDHNYLSVFFTYLFRLLLSIDKLMGYTSFFRSLRTLTSNYVISNAKITKALGQSLPFSALDGIRSLKD